MKCCNNCDTINKFCLYIDNEALSELQLNNMYCDKFKEKQGKIEKLNGKELFNDEIIMELDKRVLDKINEIINHINKEE